MNDLHLKYLQDTGITINQDILSLECREGLNEREEAKLLEYVEWLEEQIDKRDYTIKILKVLK